MSTQPLTPAANLYRLLNAGTRLKPAPRPLPIEQIKALENDLALFVREAWPILNPTRPLRWGWHYDLISEWLTLVKQRKCRRLIINIPPRCGKSTIATICFPAWCWLSEPWHSFLCGSYSTSLSTDHSVMRRNLIQSAWYQGLWSDRFQLSSDRNLTVQFTNDRMGAMIATSTGSGAEGRGGDTCILDDPMSDRTALSDLERTTANRWYSNTLQQRLNDPATAAIVIIMQRLHELDTTGFVLSEDADAWTQIVIPLEAEKDERWEFPISGRVVERKKGEILQPDRFTPRIVREKQRSRLVWAGQFQQRPAPLEGNLIKRSDVRYYGGRDPITAEHDEALPEHFDRKLISVDCAFKDTETSDYVAIIVVGVKGRKRYVLNVINDHLDVIATEQAIRGQKLIHSDASAILIEDKANGSAIITRLKTNLPGVIPVNPEGGKIGRMFAAAPEWQAQDWFLDRNGAWTEPFLHQVTMFPSGHDDMVDAMTQAAIYLGGAGSLSIYGDVWSETLLYDDATRPESLWGAECLVGVECSTSRVAAFVEVFDEGKTAWMERECYWDSAREGMQKTDVQLAAALVEFVESSRSLNRYPRILLKSGSTTFKAELVNRGFWVCESDEGNETVVAGIRATANAFALKRLRIHERCVNTIREIRNYSWDPAKQLAGEEVPLRQNSYTCNALRRVVNICFPAWRLLS